MTATSTPQQPTDEQLMLRVIEGDPIAFQRLVQRWKHPLINYFYRQVHGREVAEDLAQEVFIRLWKAKKYHISAKFSTWLYRIAYHQLVDYHRQQKRLRSGPKHSSKAGYPARPSLR